MNWIEQIFGFSPDGGSGTTEIAFSLAFLGFVSAGFFALSQRPRRQRANSQTANRLK